MDNANTIQRHEQIIYDSIVNKASAFNSSTANRFDLKFLAVL